VALSLNSSVSRHLSAFLQTVGCGRALIKKAKDARPYSLARVATPSGNFLGFHDPIVAKTHLPPLPHNMIAADDPNVVRGHIFGDKDFDGWVHTPRLKDLLPRARVGPSNAAEDQTGGH
jgi:hypothetical protein